MIRYGRRIPGRQRVLVAFVVSLTVAAGALIANWYEQRTVHSTVPAIQSQTAVQGSAASALSTLAVKGKAAKTGYAREQFSEAWGMVGGCDMREHVLGRDLTNVRVRSDTDCTVLSGTLDDPYTGKTIQFVRGPGSSSAVQIDHVVALGNAWQTGAQQLSKEVRGQLYNDPLELVAVDGPANEQKGDSDAASWLPVNKGYRCRYVARQIAVKAKYHLWVTAAERDTMVRILNDCPGQQLPTVQ